MLVSGGVTAKAPENGWPSQKETSSSSNHPFSDAFAVSFRGVYQIFFPEIWVQQKASLPTHLHQLAMGTHKIPFLELFNPFFWRPENR